MTTLSEAAKSGSRTATWLGIAVLVLGVLAASVLAPGRTDTTVNKESNGDS